MDGKPEFGSVVVTPTSGGGREGVLHVSVQQKPGQIKPVYVGVLINSREEGSHACYIYLNVPANAPGLVNDSGEGVKVLEDRSIGNEQCDLLREGTSAAVSHGTDVSADLHIRFRPAFKGAKQIYGILLDETNHGTELKPIGHWTVE